MVARVPASPSLDAAFKQAVLQHQAGRLAEAEQLYRGILNVQPAHPDANHNLGILAAQQGRVEPSLLHLRAALKANPAKGQYWLSLIEAMLDAGHTQDATTLLAQAKQRGVSGAVLDGLAARARDEASDANGAQSYAAALRHYLAGRHDEAIELFRRAIVANPEFADAHYNLGILLKEKGRLDEAAASYRRALEIRPDYAEAHNNLGLVLKEQGRLDEAMASYRHTLGIDPGFANAYLNLGSALCMDHNVPEGFASYMLYAELVHGAPDRGYTGKSVLPHKKQHDREQREYLTAMGVADGGVAVDDMLHIADGDRLAGPAVNPAVGIGDTEERWRHSEPQLVVIDNLLTDEALAKLRRFCWGSTIWRAAYEGGYLGANLEHGFACPLLAQIADELRKTYPAIFGAYPLLQAWAFKYDSHLNGIKLHADFAAVNVNFWITPDEANLDPERGGLVVWDKAAPLDWNFDKYNADNAAIHDLLARAGAKSVTVPYRANRAVIFDSNLFHETDRIAFKEGYLNRRINVTLLYGLRESAARE